MEPPPDPPDPPDPMMPVTSISTSSGGKRRLIDELQGHTAKKTIVDKEMASASIQNVYIPKSLVVGIKAYCSLDKGPFIVHVTRTEPYLSAGIRSIKFGQFLFHNKVTKICPDGVKKVGRNKISVEFQTGIDANNFLDNPILEKSQFSVTIPTFNITKMGVVRQVPVDMSMDEFVGSLILPNGCGAVLKACRLNKRSSEEGKTTWVATQTIVVTFQGQILPPRVGFHQMPKDVVIRFSDGVVGL